MIPRVEVKPIHIQLLAAMLVCAIAGALIPVSPAIGLALVASLAAFIALLVSGLNLRQLSLGFVFATIIGYMFVGRGFAYLGVGQIYIGEIALVAAAIVAATSKRQRRAVIPIKVVIVFVLLGVFRTLPFLGQYGILAIRDAALYYYAIAGVLVYFSLSQSEVLSGLRLIGNAIPFYLAWSLVQLGNDVVGFLPNFQWPGAPIGFLFTKPGDRAVVLAAIAAYTLVGLPKHLGVKYQVPSTLFWASWIGFAAVASIGARGGMLAIGIALLVVFRYARGKESIRMLVIGSAMLLLLMAWNPSVQVGSYRTLSVEQLTSNLTSIFQSSDGNEGGVERNRSWRLEFWQSIIDDAREGNQRWFGKGFGVNLASEAGFQINSEADLRSPHNVFVTVLARMGVIGLVIWIGLLVAVLTSFHRASVRWKKLGNETNAAIMIFGLSYTAAVLINATFDVYLEGPQGAIPFWCAIGAILILAEPVLHKHRPSQG